MRRRSPTARSRITCTSTPGMRQKLDYNATGGDTVAAASVRVLRCRAPPTELVNFAAKVPCLPRPRDAACACLVAPAPTIADGHRAVAVAEPHHVAARPRRLRCVLGSGLRGDGTTQRPVGPTLLASRMRPRQAGTQASLTLRGAPCPTARRAGRGRRGWPPEGRGTPAPFPHTVTQRGVRVIPPSPGTCLGRPHTAPRA